MNFGMKNSIILFLFLIPAFLFAQYPTTGNKSRLGWQTTGDGLIWRGVAGDTVNKPNNRNYPYFQLDTVNAVLYRYIATQGNWQAVGGGAVDIDSLIYATRFWVNSNFFPLQGGTLTGTGGNGFVGFPIQSSPPSTPATGFSLYAGSTGNNISWMQPDGFFRRLVSPVTGTPRLYQFMARSYTLGDSADIANNVTSIAANYLATSNGTNLVARNLFDNNTYAGVIGRPWKFGEYTTAGLPTGVNGYWLYNTDIGPGWYDGARWNYVPKADRSAFTSTYIPFTNTSGQFTQSVNLTYDLTRLTLGVDGGSIGARRMYLPESWIEYGPTLAKGRLLITQRWGGVVESPISIGAVNTDISTFNQGTITLGSRNITTDNQYNITVGNLNSISTGTGVILGKSNTVSSFSGTHLVFGNNNINSAYTNGQSASIIVGDGNNTNGFYGGGLFGSTLKYYANRQIAFGANSANLNFSISEVYFGFGVRNENNTVNSNNGHGPDISINPSQASNASDKNGGNLNMNAGRGTGAGSSGDFIIATATPISSGTTLQSLTNRWWVKGSTGMLGNTSSPNYLLDVTSTNAYGLPRGTVAQRPTIIASTTPLRFNTDSTALEYGESVGTWRQIATRAYARSLVAGLGTGTVTSVGLSLPSIFSVSGSPVTTSGTLSATFTGGNTGQFLRGDGSWSNKIVKEAGDSVIFNKPGIFGGNGAFVVYGDDGAGYQSYYERADYGYTYNYVYTNGFNDESRSYLGNARGTRLAPTSLLKGDRIGGMYFHAYGNSQFNKTAVIRSEVDSIYSGDKPMAKIIFGVDENNDAESSSNWRFIIKNERNVSVIDHVVGGNLGVGLSSLETVSIDARIHAKGAGTTTGKTMLLEDSGGADILTITDNKVIQFNGYGTAATTAAALSKTLTNYGVGFATDGTVTSREIKRDTTIYVDDADYDFSAAITTAQIASRFNRVIFWMTTTAAAGSDSELTLHTPDANLMQVEYLIHSVDEPAGFDNKIVFGTNNAVDSTNGLVTNYYPAAGDGIHIRAGLRSGVYKYRYSN